MYEYCVLCKLFDNLYYTDFIMSTEIAEIILNDVKYFTEYTYTDSTSTVILLYPNIYLNVISETGSEVF